MSTDQHSQLTARRASATWTLNPHHAMTLIPRREGEIYIAQGTAWVTLTGPHEGHGRGPLGDLYLQSGSKLRVRAGQKVVLEPIAALGSGVSAQPVTVDWKYVSTTEEARSWEVSVGQPAGELSKALGEAGLAFGRVVRGVLSWGGRWLAPRQDAPLVYQPRQRT